MNSPHNYISPLPLKEQRALYVWYTFSMWALIVFISLLLTITLYQYVQIIKIKENASTTQTALHTLQQELQQSEKMQNEQKIVLQRIKKIDALQNHHFNPPLYIKELAQKIPPNACLTELKCSKDKTIIVQGYSSTIESIITFMQSLQKSDYLKHFEITSLVPAHSHENIQWFQFTMEGALKS